MKSPEQSKQVERGTLSLEMGWIAYLSQLAEKSRFASLGDYKMRVGKNADFYLYVKIQN